jgi:pyruvate formate lyase activating enzyme
MKGLIFDIKHYAIHDGPGIRTTLFLKGCPMKCWWCHNPESQRMEPEVVEKIRRIDDIPVTKKEISGEWKSVDEVMNIIQKDSVYYDESGGGVTLSGGEPLMQFEFVHTLLGKCREHGIHTVVDTCGIASQEKFEKILYRVDLFLYDLKLMDETESKMYTGVGSEKAISNLKYIAEAGSTIHLRFPLIPGITDTAHNLEAIRDLAKSLTSIKRIDILPFHNIAKHKYHRFKKEYKLKETPEPSMEDVERIRRFFEVNGLEVGIGG